jgi:hypothetical protein
LRQLVLVAAVEQEDRQLTGLAIGRRIQADFASVSGFHKVRFDELAPESQRFTDGRKHSFRGSFVTGFL